MEVGDSGWDEAVAELKFWFGRVGVSVVFDDILGTVTWDQAAGL